MSTAGFGKDCGLLTGTVSPFLGKNWWKTRRASTPAVIQTVYLPNTARW